MPYSNEFILLSFEGHLRPFKSDPPQYGERSSYTPAAPEAVGEEPEITVSDDGFFTGLKAILTRLYGDE